MDKDAVNWETLTLYAQELSRAMHSGNIKQIEAAKKQHNEYRQRCIKLGNLVEK